MRIDKITLKTWIVNKTTIQLIQIKNKFYLVDDYGKSSIKFVDINKSINHIDFRIKKIYMHKPSPGTSDYCLNNLNLRYADKAFKKNWPFSAEEESK